MMITFVTEGSALHDYNHTISTYFHHVFISLLQGVSSTVPRVCLGRTLSTSK